MSNTNPVKDFWVIMQVASDDGIVEVKCFRSSLTIVTDAKTDDDIDGELHAMMDKECKIHIRIGKEGDMNTAEKIEFGKADD